MSLDKELNYGLNSSTTREIREEIKDVVLEQKPKTNYLKVAIASFLILGSTYFTLINPAIKNANKTTRDIPVAVRNVYNAGPGQQPITYNNPLANQ